MLAASALVLLVPSGLEMQDRFWRGEGAEGPCRAAPSFMVVVPTQETVTLRFEDTCVEWTGRVLKVAPLAWLMIQAVGRRRAAGTT